MSITKVQRKELSNIDEPAKPVLPGSYVRLKGDANAATVMWGRDPLVVAIHEIKPCGDNKLSKSWITAPGMTLLKSTTRYESYESGFNAVIEEVFLCTNTPTKEDIEKIKSCSGIRRIDIDVKNTRDRFSYVRSDVKVTVTRAESYDDHHDEPEVNVFHKDEFDLVRNI